MFAGLLATANRPVCLRRQPTVEELESRLAPTLPTPSLHAPMPPAPAVLAIVQAVRTPHASVAVVVPTTAPPVNVAPPALVNGAPASPPTFGSIIVAQPEESPALEPPPTAVPLERVQSEPQELELLASAVTPPSAPPNPPTEVPHIHACAPPTPVHAVTSTDAPADAAQAQPLPLFAWVVGLAGVGDPARYRKRHGRRCR